MFFLFSEIAMLFPPHRLAALLLAFFLAAPAWGQWINEIHYDNVGADVGEAVEVVLPTSAVPADFTLHLYNGSNGQTYENHRLDTFTMGAAENGVTVYYKEIGGIQNGDPDGLSLSENGVLIPGQFLSYGGVFVGANGPATGVASVDIGVSEGGSTPIGHSLQLIGTGTAYDDFAWAGPMEATFGSVNGGQTIGGPLPPIVSFVSPNSQTVTEGTDTQVEIAVQITNAGSEEVSVDVVLTGGTADPGDFGGETTRTVTFPANAPDGSTQIATFPLIDDEENEGTETAIFELQNPSGGPGAVIGSPSSYTLTIEDDDAVIPVLVINEIHADPDDIAGDANNDGAVSATGAAADEFVEIVNVSGGVLDIGHYTLSDADMVRHVFPLGTRLEALQAVVVFGGGSPQGSFGGALVHVATTGGLSIGNSAETISLRDTNGVVVAEVSRNMGGNINQSLTRNPDLTGDFVQHTGAAGEGVLFSPGTRVDGTPFGGGNAGAIVTVPKGTAGWRMLAPPVAGMTVGDLAAQNLVQGIPGEYPGAAANLYTDYTGTGFVPASGKEEVLTSGGGFIWFLYDVRFNPHDAGITDGESESFPLPFTLEALGAEPAGDVTVDLHQNGEGWNLLGNPFAEAIDLDQMEVNGGEGGLVSIIGQVWDPVSRTYELTSNNPISNTLAIWQGAFFQNDDAASVTFPADSKIGSGAPFYGRPGGGSERGQIGFELAGPGWESGQPASLDRAAVLYLHEEAADGWDLRDATKLTPLTSTYATLAFVGEREGSEVLKAQEARPFEGGPFEVPLAFESVGVSGGFALSWPRWDNVPEDWAITLTDAETGAVVDLRADTLYAFTASAARESAADDPLAAPQAESLQRSGEARFVLTVGRGTVDAEGGAAPLAFALDAVYPNPVADVAAVRYALPEAADVRLVVFDVLGRAVATLADGPQPAGRHTAALRTDGLASGVYVVQLRSGGDVASRRFVVIR